MPGYVLIAGVNSSCTVTITVSRILSVTAKQKFSSPILREALIIEKPAAVKNRAFDNEHVFI